MQTVAETPTFSRQADKLFSEDEKRELIDFLAEHPLAGDEIPGTGGVRKLLQGDRRSVARGVNAIWKRQQQARERQRGPERDFGPSR